ncbi:anhydro-N-acetylmuramic acid kinase [Sinimarinibacterium sp. NLF-5-8]|uniref:anhydro-N-acetylmuramic acid kinase n=1 Tax=Sinimarinibacterium sp. NLF-5-8 TaxID=2698684 RepID=UPI001EE3F740|nr:anhydro-N-acetylmuramic acid kinase [Sinimarinibacterium sp. NLF-5-8]
MPDSTAQDGFFIGLMSGTSMDGVDAALCQFKGGRLQTIIGTGASNYPSALRSTLIDLQLNPDRSINLAQFARLDHAVAQAFVDAVQDALQSTALPANQIVAIGSHGQTVFHDPQSSHNSLQIGNPNWIAAQTKIPVVSDFRRMDMALGGQGAPLVPAFHAAFFANATPCTILNLGGIANVTLLEEGTTAVRGFDTGPGNGLMDAWIQQHQHRPFDQDGAWAASGHCIPELLEACLSDPYFAQPAPKSTGRDYFNLGWLQRQDPLLYSHPAEDVQHTLCALTAESIARQLPRWAAHATRAQVWVCGGGARNGELMRQIRDALSPSRVNFTVELGLDGQMVEAAAFAWLAQRRFSRQAVDLCSVTGARAPAILGGLYLPPGNAQTD